MNKMAQARALHSLSSRLLSSSLPLSSPIVSSVSRNVFSRTLLSSRPSFSIAASNKLRTPYTFITRSISSTPPSTPSPEVVVEVASDPIINATGDPVLLITGPVSFLEVILEAVHTTTGIPWWGLIIGFTLSLRLALVPLAYKQRVNMVHTINIYPDVMKLVNSRKQARVRGDQKLVDHYYKEITELTGKYNVSPVKNFMVLAVQVPVLVCFFFALSDMAATFPSFLTGGFYETSLKATPAWWAPILSFMPGILANELSNPVAKFQIIMKWAIRGLYAIAIPFSYLLPSAIMYYWLPSNIFSAVQSYILNDPKISKQIGIPEVKKGRERV